MAAREAPQRQPSAPQDAVPDQCLSGVLGAGRAEPARRRQPRGNDELVDPHRACGGQPRRRAQKHGPASDGRTRIVFVCVEIAVDSGGRTRFIAVQWRNLPLRAPEQPCGTEQRYHVDAPVARRGARVSVDHEHQVIGAGYVADDIPVRFPADAFLPVAIDRPAQAAGGREGDPVMAEPVRGVPEFESPSPAESAPPEDPLYVAGSGDTVEPPSA